MRVRANSGLVQGFASVCGIGRRIFAQHADVTDIGFELVCENLLGDTRESEWGQRGNRPKPLLIQVQANVARNTGNVYIVRSNQCGRWNEGRIRSDRIQNESLGRNARSWPGRNMLGRLAVPTPPVR